MQLGMCACATDSISRVHVYIGEGSCGSRYVQRSYENLEKFREVKKKSKYKVRLISNLLHSVQHTKAPITTPLLLSIIILPLA